MLKIFIAAAIVLIVAVIIILLLYHFGFIEFYHPMKQAKNNQIKVACVGDSITFGCTVRNRNKNNYPAVLGRMLGEKYCVNNFGYTNRTAIKSADYPYTNEKLYQQSLDLKPDIVVIMLGSNDSKVNNWDRDKFIKDYCEIIDSYLKSESSPKVYVLAPPPLFEIRGKVMWQLRKNIVDNEICPVVKFIADKMNVHYIDMHSIFENKRELFSDGVHPNAKGSRLFAQTIYEAIIETKKSNSTHEDV
ncbi:MAG: hypothetical protein HFJ98_00685 [Eubacterium sp.]|nr:hypothetical protein [Eubacterium sp.]